MAKGLERGPMIGSRRRRMKFTCRSTVQRTLRWPVTVLGPISMNMFGNEGTMVPK